MLITTFHPVSQSSFFDSGYAEKGIGNRESGIGLQADADRHRRARSSFRKVQA
jgi:hypothetical protein